MRTNTSILGYSVLFRLVQLLIACCVRFQMPAKGRKRKAKADEPEAAAAATATAANGSGDATVDKKLKTDTAANGTGAAAADSKDSKAEKTAEPEKQPEPKKLTGTTIGRDGAEHITTGFG